MIDRIAIAGYRSIRALVLRLEQLNVVTGANGSGKSNLYRALRLLADAADGRLLHSLAQEGGFDSVLWAGPEKITNEMLSGEVPVQGGTRSKPVSLKLGFTAEPFSYCFDLGLPQPSGSMFGRDPQMKRECLWRGANMEAKNMCADRRAGALRCRGATGKWCDIELPLGSQASMLSEYSDPYGSPEILIIRDRLKSWRFYDSFRTDADAPARRTSVGTLTPVLTGDGSDLAAALQTIREIGDSEALHQSIDDAFPGTHLEIRSVANGMQLALRQPGMLRELSATELSDGTLRFLLLSAALLSPRPPELLVLNEPENSLHPELIPALSRLIDRASQRSQMLVVSHSQSLVSELESTGDAKAIRLEKRLGETVIQDANMLDQFGWKWPPR